MRDRYASLREGLVGAWIPSVSGSGLLLPDLSGNGNNGTLTNMGPEDWVSSQYGRALDFDGVNDYVTIQNSSILNFSVSSVSVAAWIFTDNSNSVIIARHQDGGSGGGTGNGPELDINSGNLRFNESEVAVLVSTPVPSPNTWHHVAGVLDTDANKAYIYIDGKLSNSTSSIANEFDSSLHPWWVGVSARTPKQAFFNGQLDDIRIYNRALSEPEIKLLASRPGIGLRPQRRTMYYAPPTGARRRRILTSMP